MEQEYWKGNRFLGVKIEYLKIELGKKNTKIHKIKGTVNPADILTKPVTRTQFETLVRIMEAGYTTFTYLSEPFLIRSSLMRITEISLLNSGSLPSVQHRTYRLVYRSGSPIQAVIYSDASHGSAADIPYATRGYIVQMAGGTVTWSSKKIKMVTLSSTEAEYVAVCEAVKEAAWLTHLFIWMRSSPLRTRLLVDNQPAIHIAQNPVCHSRIKHIRLDYHYIRGCSERVG